jgi:uncharacterized protein (DUF433 family)
VADTAIAAHGFSLKEAAALAEVPEHSIRKALEARTLTPVVTHVGRVPRYSFRSRDLLYLSLVHEFPIALSTADRLDLWRLFQRRRTEAGAWRWHDHELIASHGDVCLRVDTEPLKARLVERLRTFRLGRHRVVRDPAILSGEPVFEGTRIPLAHIVGLIRKGVEFDEIREDYPSLSEADLEYASLLARMKADPGRPRKALTLLRARKPESTSRPKHATADR